MQLLTDLRPSGVKLHLDDFGIGFSSLSSLQRFRIDAVKVDGSFVKSMTEHRENGYGILCFARQLSV